MILKIHISKGHVKVSSDKLGNDEFPHDPLAGKSLYWIGNIFKFSDQDFKTGQRWSDTSQDDELNEMKKYFYIEGKKIQ